MEGHSEGSLSHHSQQQQQPHQQNPQNHPYYGYTPQDYQYPPGQHWLTGSSGLGHQTSDHNYNAHGALPAFGYHHHSSSSSGGGGGHQQNNCGQGNNNPHTTMTSPHNSQPHMAPHYSNVPLHSSQHGDGNTGNNGASALSNSGNSSGPGGYHHQLQNAYPNCCPSASSSSGSGPNNENGIIVNLNNNQGGQNPNHNNQMSSISNMMVANMCPRNAWTPSSESMYPGGLDILWREVPEECQKLINMQDIPDTAKFRGYFTVCELIALKRSLMSRLSSHVEISGHQGAQRPGPTRQQQEEQGPPPAPQTNEGSGSGVGMAVKEAMNTLEEVSNQNTPEGQEVSNKQDQQQEYQSTKSPRDTNTAEDQDQRKEDEEGERTARSQSASTPSTESISASQGTCSTGPISSASTSAGTITPTNSVPYSNGHPSGIIQHHPQQNNPGPPPPPYRTATLVFKLLQIGNYQFRSFSEINPNRLRVLFNTQRITYECHLSLVRPPREGMQPLRKLLTVDIGFDQISVIRFGHDKLFLRVEGPPLLTVTYNPCNDDNTCPPLSPQDHILLEQIDKGQLKLSPCHQLYFLNTRLVGLLETQFREHPRFRNILQMNAMCPQPPHGENHPPHPHREDYIVGP